MLLSKLVLQARTMTQGIRSWAFDAANIFLSDIARRERKSGFFWRQFLTCLLAC
jgi:hypothetical protein